MNLTRRELLIGGGATAATFALSGYGCAQPQNAAAQNVTPPSPSPTPGKVTSIAPSSASAASTQVAAAPASTNATPGAKPDAILDLAAGFNAAGGAFEPVAGVKFVVMHQSIDVALSNGGYRPPPTRANPDDPTPWAASRSSTRRSTARPLNSSCERGPSDKGTAAAMSRRGRVPPWNGRAPRARPGSAP